MRKAFITLALAAGFPTMFSCEIFSGGSGFSQADYDAGYGDGSLLGEVDGYDDGLSDGLDSAYLSGYDLGYVEGYNSVYESCYVTGYLDYFTLPAGKGRSTQRPIDYDNGYTDGYYDGYDYGYSNGYYDGENDYATYETGYYDGVGYGESDGCNDGYIDGYNQAAADDSCLFCKGNVIARGIPVETLAPIHRQTLEANRAKVNAEGGKHAELRAQFDAEIQKK